MLTTATQALKAARRVAASDSKPCCLASARLPPIVAALRTYTNYANKQVAHLTEQQLGTYTNHANKQVAQLAEQQLPL